MRMKILQLLLLSTVYIIHKQAAGTSDIIIEFENVNGEATDGDEPIPHDKMVCNYNETLNLQFMLHLLKRMAPVGISDDFPIFDPWNLGYTLPVQLGKNLSVKMQDVMLEGLKGYEIAIHMVADVLVLPPNKLIYFSVKLPPLLAKGNILIHDEDAVIMGNVTIVTKDQRVEGVLMAYSGDGPERPIYQIGGVHVKHHLDYLKIVLQNMKQTNGRKKMVNAKKNFPGDVIAKIAAHEVRKGVNKLLTLVYVDQLQALLGGNLIAPVL